VAVVDNVATLTLDTTGPGLNKRGYRTLQGAAPLKETLAAAMILLSGWQPDRPLVDPFCGTGTIAIEAALIARNLAPGLQRGFSAEAWPRLEAALWQGAREDASAAARTVAGLTILGSDVDAEALSLARYHAKQAGVAGDVQFAERDFRELTSKREHGFVICNPPYGERLGERSEVEALYRQMPAVLARVPTWSCGILTSHPRFERLVGRKADRRRKLYNGQIECYYYQFDADVAWAASPCEPEPPSIPRRSPEPVPPQDKTRQQAELFASRLANRARHLRRWPTKRGITCYQLYDRDVPEIPLTVDRYEDALHLVEHERPHDRTPQQHAAWLDSMAAAASLMLETPAERVFLKRLEDRRWPLYDSPNADQNLRLVNEAGLCYRVNLADYSDTGFTLDHRQIRALVRELAPGKNFLTLFGYTGAFSVCAAAGGAISTTTVDLFPSHLHWAGENLALNGFTGEPHRQVAADGLSFLESHPLGACYDLTVVDPPNSSDRSAASESWEFDRDHVTLLSRLAELMTPGGVVLLVTPNRRFKLAEDRLPQYTIRDISRQTVPEDFRNDRIHRCWRLVRGAAGAGALG
jgi:23S rRNA (guanine2445-N2)-methyltransferase / 23S rRNA (guanine2069-N7)-methyltransferase